MSDTVTVALIGAAASIVGPVVIYLVTSRRHQETKQLLEENTGKTDDVLHQVQNDHETNLRDELDARFKGLHDKLSTMEGAQAGLGATVGRLRRDVASALHHQREHEAASVLAVEQLHRRDAELAEQIRQVRQSDPPPG